MRGPQVEGLRKDIEQSTIEPPKTAQKCNIWQPGRSRTLNAGSKGVDIAHLVGKFETRMTVMTDFEQPGAVVAFLPSSAKNNVARLRLK